MRETNAFTTEEQAFLDEILNSPGDDQVRLVYADWLEERGDDRSRYVRAEVEFSQLAPDHAYYDEYQSALRTLQLDFDRAWVVLLARSPIENCPIDFEFQCPKRWDKLAPTEEQFVRYCTECHRNVYHCQSIPEARLKSFLGECIAVDSSLAREPDDLAAPMLLGRPTRDSTLDFLKEEARQETKQEFRRSNQRRRKS